MAIPCILWLFTYEKVGHWNGGGIFSFDAPYFASKVKSNFFVNFNYILLILSVVCLVVTIAKWRKHVKVVFPIFLSMAVYFVVSALFITVNHPRYADAIIAQLNLLVAFFIINYIPIQAEQYALAAVIALAMGISSFFSIDPIMLKLHKNINVGNIVMITTSETLSDGMAYNRQYQKWGGYH